MFGKKPVKVDSYHKKDGKHVSGYVKYVQSTLKQPFTNADDVIEIVDLDGSGIISVPSVVYEKIVAEIDTPLNILKDSGFSPRHIKQLVELNGVDTNGYATIINRNTGKGMKSRIFNIYGSDEFNQL